MITATTVIVTINSTIRGNQPIILKELYSKVYPDVCCKKSCFDVAGRQK